MDNKKIRAIGAGILVAVWLALTGFSWFGPAKDISEAERRPLEQMPEITLDSLWKGKFMGDFEDYTLDQFPLRDPFRQLKALFHYNALQQKDNNGIYIADGYAAKVEYPLNQDSVNYAAKRFNDFYNKFLKDSGSNVFMTVVPDKGYYLAQPNGYLAMDYQAMFDALQEKLPWATHIDITDCLGYEDYYRTDTHWRQEKLLGVAQKLCEALETGAFQQEELALDVLDRPFYGVYYGQAALPMDAEQMYVMHHEILENCTVYNHENGKTTGIYDWSKLESQDLYDVFLSGAAALLTIENPAGDPGKELIVFRDSYGSSLIPLLLKDYAKVTVIDTRYIASDLLDRFVDFHGQDVLMLYSALLLNSSFSLK